MQYCIWKSLTNAQHSYFVNKTLVNFIANMQSSKIYIYYLISLKLLNNMIEPFQKRKVNKRRDDWQKQVEFCTYYSWQEYKITAVGKYLGPY